MGKRPPNWTADELEHLLEMAGDVPRPMLCRVYNVWASRHGYPYRSYKALLMQADKHKASLKAVGSWITTGGLASILGLPPSTTESWLRHNPDLPRQRLGRQRVQYINRDQFKEWVRGRMRLLGGLERSRLVMLFDDEAFADEILEKHPVRPLEANGKPVRCIDDGREWPSILAASKAIFVEHSSLWVGIQEKRPVVGLRFELIERPY